MRPRHEARGRAVPWGTGAVQAARLRGPALLDPAALIACLVRWCSRRVRSAEPGGPIMYPKILLLVAISWICGTGAAHACACEPISPEAGFARAQYVFAGKVVQAEHHTWLIEVERVWKGHDKLART